MLPCQHYSEKKSTTIDNCCAGDIHCKSSDHGESYQNEDEEIVFKQDDGDNNYDDTEEAMQNYSAKNHDADCSICLRSISIGQKVSWSGLECPHLYHQHCLVDWFHSIVAKYLNDHRNSNGENNDVENNGLENVKLTCPTCRQEFLK